MHYLCPLICDNQSTTSLEIDAVPSPIRALFNTPLEQRAGQSFRSYGNTVPCWMEVRQGEERHWMKPHRPNKSQNGNWMKRCARDLNHPTKVSSAANWQWISINNVYLQISDPFVAHHGRTRRYRVSQFFFASLELNDRLSVSQSPILPRLSVTSSMNWGSKGRFQRQSGTRKS